MTTNNNNTTTNTDNNSTTTMTDDSLYKGPVKMIWNDKGQRIQVPDYGPFDNPSASIAAASTPNINNNSEYTYKKTVEDVISSTDTFQYDRLKTDKDRYAFIRNMIT
jgi:hypothetical protein